MEDVNSRHQATVVGLAGAARSGKDTLANLMTDQMGFVRIAFADPIKRFVSDLLDITIDEIEPIKEAPQDLFNGKTPRQVMQDLGTEWGRDTIAYDLWIQVCMRKVKRNLNAGRSVVVTDARFGNEAQAILNMNGPVIRLNRPDLEGTRSGAGHVSEQRLPDSLVSFELTNNGTPWDLFEAAQQPLAERIRSAG